MSVVARFGFKILNVAKDGDCLFKSILIQLQQMIFHLEKTAIDHLLNLSLCQSTNPLSEEVLILQSAMVNKWIQNKED